MKLEEYEKQLHKQIVKEKTIHKHTQSNNISYVIFTLTLFYSFRSFLLLSSSLLSLFSLFFISLSLVNVPVLKLFLLISTLAFFLQLFSFFLILYEFEFLEFLCFFLSWIEVKKGIKVSLI